MNQKLEVCAPNKKEQVDNFLLPSPPHSTP